jgi:hypothetical protein
MHYCDEFYVLHYHVIYCHQLLFVSCALYYNRLKFVASSIFYLED